MCRDALVFSLLIMSRLFLPPPKSYMEKKNMCVLFYRASQISYKVACTCGVEIDVYVWVNDEKVSMKPEQENSYLFDKEREKHFFRVVREKLQICLHHRKALYVVYVCAHCREECHLHVFNND